MAERLPEVILKTTASVDGRITLGPHDRLLDPDVGRRWATIQTSDAFTGRDDELDSTVVLESSGSFVDIDADSPDWPPPRLSAEVLLRDQLPRRAFNWFVVADGRGRVDWTVTGDGTTALHVLVCRTTHSATSSVSTTLASATSSWVKTRLIREKRCSASTFGLV